ncbi:MAG: endolytic transglycosylase MltG [Candidatus Symbiobacter sp.]|nr:endolytic transglycosylase MltG [Candidatus Symbiobacter sp.]
MTTLPPDDALAAEAASPLDQKEFVPSGTPQITTQDGQTILPTNQESATPDHYETKAEEAERLAQERLVRGENAVPPSAVTPPANSANPVNSANSAISGRIFARLVRPAFLLLVLSVSVIAAIFLFPGGYSNEKVLDFESGKTLSQISTDLAQQEVIHSSFIFKLVLHAPCLVSFGRYCPEYVLKAGEYRFAPGLSMWEIARQMVRGEVILHQLTVPEGLRVVDVWEIVRNSPYLAGDLPRDLPPEGALLPETYDAERGEQRAVILGRMMAAMARQTSKIWAERDLSIPLRSPLELVTLASIVERETALPEERPRVAAVYLNRLRRSMRLQADPTVVYAIGLANPNKPLRKILFTKDLLKPSPYNTYVNFGLPPGPIANPGVQSLLAVAHPLVSNELYFVANGRGGHNFASNLVDHNRNVAAWKKMQSK